MPIILPNTRGHYPKGYPIGTGVGGSASGYDVRQLEQATETPDLTLFKTAIEEMQGDASAYFGRNQNARDWLYARWPGQTIDGLKWNNARMGIEAWPWQGASDTRVRLIEKVCAEHRTLATFALRNMKVQAKASRPFVSQKESEQNTTLINWLLFTHMGAELHLELRLAIAWRNIYGASVLSVDWDQQRMLDYIDVSVPGLQDFINEPAVQSFLTGGNSQSPGSNSQINKIPIGEQLTITDLQEMIMDPAYADDLAQLLKTISHDYLTVKAARAKLDDLRQLRTVEIPIPYVYKSRPRITALRPMVDVIYRGECYDFQREMLIDRVEYVSAATLKDRTEIAGYSKSFVEAALDKRGPSSGTNATWLNRTATERGATNDNEYANDIELHHAYTLVHDRGVPVRFCTVFHMDIEEPAKHAPYGYDHGEACFHPMRFEIVDRPINSSQGIAEKAYTWEQEIKAQRDMRTDRAAMSLRPVIFTTYEDLAKMKAAYMPGSFIPMSKFGSIEKDKPPIYDPAVVQIEQEVLARVREYFGIFGDDLDQALKKMKTEEFVDDIIAELKPPVQQVRKLCQQLLPDDEVTQVVGPLARPFHVSREALQGDYEMTMTVDLRDIDSDWAKERFAVVPQILALDTQGLINRTPIIKTMLSWLSYDLAESALPDDQQEVTEAEVQDEQRAIDLIIGSGQDQPLPKGANYQLRLQTLQAKQQSFAQNPATMKIIQANPDIMKVIMNRAQFFQRQLQQLQNAQIGRMQVGTTFTNQAPQIADQAPVAAAAGGGAPAQGAPPGSASAVMQPVY